MSGLTLLNGADVKPRERRDCELRYLQNVLAEQAEAAPAAAAAAGGQQQQSQQQAIAVQQHPRVPQLKAQYGQVRYGMQRQPGDCGERAFNSSTTKQLRLGPWV